MLGQTDGGDLPERVMVAILSEGRTDQQRESKSGGDRNVSGGGETVRFRDLANEGPGDRVIRVLIGIGMFAVGWFGSLPDIWAVACKIFCWHFLVSGLVGWSPLYALFGLSTRRRPSV